MSVEPKNVRRIAAVDKVNLESELAARMLGFETSTGFVGAKKPSGDMLWYTPEHGDAVYDKVKVEGLAGTGDRNIGVDSAGNLKEVAGGGSNVQSDWTETDTNDDAFIKNKPTIPAAQVNSDWNANTGVAAILNKPILAPSDAEKNVQSDWNETDATDDAFILNKPALATQTLQQTTTAGNTTTDDIIVGSTTGDNTTITDGNGVGAPGLTMRKDGEEGTVLFDKPNERITTNRNLRGGAEYTPSDRKDYVQKSYVDDHAGSSLWSATGTDILNPTVDYKRTDVGVQGNVDLGGKFNVEGSDITTVSTGVSVAGSDVVAANGAYAETSTGSGVWKHATNDWYVKMIGQWNWTVSSANNDDWNNVIAYKTSNLTVPNGGYLGHNNHSGLTVADGGGAVYTDAIATKGSIFASDTIKTGTKLLVQGDVSYGRTTNAGAFIGGNVATGENILEVNNATTLMMKINEDGSASLPQCSTSDIDHGSDIATKAYADLHGSALGVNGGGKVHVGDSHGGWIPRGLHLNQTTTDLEIKAGTGLDMDLSTDSGHHVRVITPTEDLDVANKKYVDDHSGGGDNVQGASTLHGTDNNAITTISGDGSIKRNTGGFQAFYGSNKSIMYAGNSKNEFGSSAQNTHIAGKIVSLGINHNAPMLTIDDTSGSKTMTTTLSDAEITAGGDQSIVTKKWVEDNTGGAGWLGQEDSLNASDGSGGNKESVWRISGNDAQNIGYLYKNQHGPTDPTKAYWKADGGSGMQWFTNWDAADFKITMTGGSNGSNNPDMLFGKSYGFEGLKSPFNNTMPDVNWHDDNLVTKKYGDAHYRTGGMIYTIDPLTPKSPSGTINAWSASTTYVYEVTLSSSMTTGKIPITQINHAIAADLSASNFPHVDAFAISANKVEVRVRVDEWTDISQTGAEIYVKII